MENNNTDMLLNGYEKEETPYKPLKENKRILGMNVKKETNFANVFALLYLPLIVIAGFAFINA